MSTPPQKKSQPQTQQAPKTAPPERAVSGEDMSAMMTAMMDLMNRQREMGKAERDWHKACMDFYSAEEGMKKFEQELVKKYNMQPDEVLNPLTGKIVKRK